MVDAPATAGRRWRVVVGTLAGLFLGGVFLYAVWGKVFDAGAFAETIELEGLDFWLSAPLLSYLVLTLEAAIGLALLLNMRRLWVLVPTALLVAFFMFINGRAYVGWLNGEVPSTAACGCFGHVWDRTPAEAFWYDAALMVPPLVLAFLGRPRGAFPRARFAFVTVVSLLVGVFAWKAIDFPLDDFATRLKPGVDVADLCTGTGDDEFCLGGPTVDPQLTAGRHVVLLADLGDAAFLDSVASRRDEIEAWVFDADRPRLVCLHSGTKEEEAQFEWKTQGAPLERLAAPQALLRPMYRTLPRTFLVVDGKVSRTWTGFPSLDQVAEELEVP